MYNQNIIGAPTTEAPIGLYPIHKDTKNGSYFNGSEPLASAILKEVETTNALPDLVIKSAQSAAEKLKCSRLDPGKKIEEPPVAFEVLGSSSSSAYATLGNFSLIIGKAKSRKTFFVSLVVAALLSKEPVMKKFKSLLKQGSRRVLFFDTEQASYHVQKVQGRISTLLQAGSCPNLDMHCLRPYSTEERLEIIEYAIYNTADLGVVVIDGIRDLVKDINSAEEATMITNKLLKWTEERNIHIITVLHQNKADNNARGHVGTELLNKAESVISVAKDTTNPDNSIVTPEYFRGKDFEPFAFSIDQDGLPFIVDEWVSGSKEPKKALEANNVPDEFHKARLKEAFAIDPKPSYKHLWLNVQTAFLIYTKVGDSKAKSFIQYYVSKGWIKKVDPPESGKTWPLYSLNLPG